MAPRRRGARPQHERRAEWSRPRLVRHGPQPKPDVRDGESHLSNGRDADLADLLLDLLRWARRELGDPHGYVHRVRRVRGLSIERRARPHRDDQRAGERPQDGLQYLDYLGRTLPW